MKYNIGQKVKINKGSLLGVDKGDVGIIVEINDYTAKNYKVFFNKKCDTKVIHEEHLSIVCVNNDHEEIFQSAKNIIKIINDFNTQVQKAGGCIWDIEGLENTSALDLILHLAPNGVKFKYNGK